VAARFGDAADARAAIEALQSAGIDGDDIALLSPFPQTSRRSTNAADERMGRYLVRRVLVGALLGVVGGVVAGALVGGIVIAVTTPASELGQLVAFAIASGIIGAPLGAYIGFERAGTLSEAWGTTFEDLERGATWVGVKVHDVDHYLRARRALERRHPAELRELEAPDA
jgi:hypothetical protein